MAKRKLQKIATDRTVRFELELYHAEIEWVQNQLNCSQPEAIAIMREKIRYLLRDLLESHVWTLFEEAGTRALAKDRLGFSVRGDDLGGLEEAVYKGACGWWYLK